MHQKKEKTMRYFKWGVARLILEPNECPDIVPIFVEGNDQVMHESRRWPRFVPRPGKELTVSFGGKVDVEEVFGELRRKWRKLKEKDEEASGFQRGVGELGDDLKFGREAVELRKETTMRIRQEVLKVRRSRGLPDEDPKQGMVETWIHEGSKKVGKMEDGSWIGRT